MFNLARPLKTEDYLVFLWRRKWWILIPFVLVSAAGIYYTLHMPKLYRASTLILVVPQRVPPEYIRPTVTSTIEERLSSISAQIMSRTNLWTIIEELDLYPQERKELGPEEIIALMRKNIEIQLKGDRRKKDAFELFFAGSDPRTAMLVTNRLASLFIEQNLRMRERQAEGTAVFLADQLEKTKAELERQEKRITAFKAKYMGQLPEQLDANLGVLQQLQMQVQRISDSIRSAEDRRVLYLNQITEIKRLILQAKAQAPREEASLLGTASAPLSERERLLEELAALRAKYTDKHPDVVALKRRIRELEEEGPETPSEGGSTTIAARVRQVSRPSAVRPSLDQMDTMLVNLQAQLAAVDSEIRGLRQKEKEVQSRIREYERRIEDTPRIEQMMTELARDYENTKKVYESLLVKKLEAEQAMAMEQRQQGEQFRILDPAQMPAKPWKPDLKKMFALSLALGLGAGLGLGLLVEYMDRSFKDPEDLEAFTGLKVVAVVPKVQTPERGALTRDDEELSAAAMGRGVSL